MNIINAVHYSRKEKPGNLLNYNAKKIVEIIKTQDGDPLERLSKRIFIEQKMKEVAKNKISNNIIDHPLYFAVNADNPFKVTNKKNIYNIDKDLLKKSTFTIGDSLRAMNSDNNFIKQINKKVLSFDELKKIKDSIKDNLKKNDYIEGQLWSDFTIKNNKIMPK